LNIFFSDDVHGDIEPESKLDKLSILVQILLLSLADY
jgi:hypothetical protein